MERTRALTDLERFIPAILIVGGLALMGVSLVSGMLAGGLADLGPNQFAVAVAGLAIFLGGAALATPPEQRDIPTWLLLGVSALGAGVTADIFFSNGLTSLPVKVLMLASAGFGLLLTAALEDSLSPLDLPARLADLIRLRTHLAQFFSLVVQFALLLLLARQFQLENQAFYHNILLLAFSGFLLQFLLPLRWRLPFFLLLSLAAFAGLLGLANAAWLFALAIALLAIVHLPFPFPARIALLLLAAAALAFLRLEPPGSPIPGLIWPLLGSIFMFRLIVYLYDLRHAKSPPSPTQSLAYFFLLPNVVFPFFPVVDFAAFRRSFFDSDRFLIAQSGLRWILRGFLQLIAYRIVNYYFVLAPEQVSSSPLLLQFILSNFLLYLRVSGHFHLIIGLLHLFGFNLPETNHRYLLASSFTDFWRRINIYWKDFMLKVFYYPAYFALKRLPTTARLVLATLFVFIATWFLHAYQWFWLRGSAFFLPQDILFWSLLASIMVANSLYDARQSPKRSLSKDLPSLSQLVPKALATAATFATITSLWSLWTSASIPDWLSLWSVAFQSPAQFLFLPLAFLALAALFLFALFLEPRFDRSLQPFTSPKTFFRPAFFNAALALAVLLIASPAVSNRLPAAPQAFLADLRSDRLSDRDAALLQRGYYEDLIGVNRFNSELWDVYTKRPTDWPLIHETELARLTGDFRFIELQPSTSTQFHGEPFTTNQWGMRDKPYDQVPSPNTTRIALIGPSFVMGSGVADEDVFEWIVEARLNQDHPDRNFEILNFGVAGYTALQELMVFENKILDFQPDVVLYVSHQLETDIAYRMLANGITNGVDIPYPFLKELAESAGLTAENNRLQNERLLRPFGQEIIGWTYQQFAEVARQNGIIPVWVFIPTMETPYHKAEIAPLFRMAEEAGFTTLDLSGAYDGLELEDIIVAVWDLHPNELGHEILAEALYQALEEHAGQILFP